MTWTGAGKGEWGGRSWTVNGVNYTDGYTDSPLGLAGRTTNTPNTPSSSQFVRDPSGTPVAERNSDGTEYYYLFDGQGNVVGLEDPGTMVASYDFCPTGNEADLRGGTQMTQAALNNPLRQGAAPYDDDLKDYFGSNGVIKEDYSGVGTQTAAIRFGDVQFLALGAQPLRFSREVVAESGPSCDANTNPEESSADTSGCNVTQDTSGEASASAGGTAASGGGQQIQRWPPSDLQETQSVPWVPQKVQDMQQGPVPSGAVNWKVNAVIIIERIVRIITGNG